MTKTLSIYDELVWDHENSARPEISALTLADTLAVLGMHTGTFVAVEAWAACDWAGIDSLSAEGHLLPVREDESLDDLYGPLPLEASNLCYSLWTPTIELDGQTLVPSRIAGRFHVDAAFFDGASLQGHSATDPASLYIDQRWSRSSRLRLVVRFWGSWKTEGNDED